MSTRGCVALRTEDGSWQGVYNHYDSYPTSLGERLWKHLKWEVDVKVFEHRLLRYGTWDGYTNKGVCEYCGQQEGNPHTINGKIMPSYDGYDRLETDIQENIKETGYPDPDAEYHDHTDAENAQLNPENVDPVFIEWVYVVDPDSREVEILASNMSEEYETVEIVDLDGDEPDWEEIEKSA